MTSRFRHVLCLHCYQAIEPGRTPVPLVDPDPELCCRCGKLTLAPIYYRDVPGRFPCRGTHEPA